MIEDISGETGKPVRPLRNGRHTGRGSRRAGAGRKPNYLKRRGIKAITAADILAHFNEPDLWRGLLLNKSDIRLRTLADILQIDGMARLSKPLTYQAGSSTRTLLTAIPNSFPLRPKSCRHSIASLGSSHCQRQMAHIIKKNQTQPQPR